MRKRRERQRGKHASASTEDVESEDAGQDESELPVAAEDVEPEVRQAESSGSDLPGPPAVVVEPVVVEPVVAEPVVVEPVVAEHGVPEWVEPETIEPVAPAEIQVPTAATSGASAGPSDDLDALGRMLERSLTGNAEGPLPTVSSPAVSPPGGPIDLTASVLPPDISATPEDILGVPTHHTAMQELQQQAVEGETDGDPEKPVTLAGAGTGVAPMEAFEERAQMAKEVLRATSSQPSHASVPVSGGGPPTEAEPDGAEERDEDVRFSEDLTISVKRRRKLFGR
jgi:hypothetical protein